MNYMDLIRNISFNLSSVAHCRLGEEWDYKDVVSTFSRLLLITDGEAFVDIGKTKVKLQKGYLYLIPSFLHCSYYCPGFMEQYYAIFTITFPDGMNLYQLFNTRHQVKATPFHYEIFRKLCDENKGMALPHGNPEKYQKDIKTLSLRQQNLKSLINSSGILSLLISEFIESPKLKIESETQKIISESIKYIHMHISNDLSLSNLADQSNMSTDHYTRKFKELTGQTPVDYINRQRIEKAQLLINTTSSSLTDIAYQCGFNCSSYFSKVFKKYVHTSPRRYKKNNRGNSNQDAEVI